MINNSCRFLIVFLLGLLLGAGAGSAWGALVEKAGVTRDGITWTFKKPAPVGQFVNGDYYVVGPVTVVKIDPPPSEKEGRNGSARNLPAGATGKSPFDRRVLQGRYAPELRAAPPVHLKPGDTLISAISTESGKKYPMWLREQGSHKSPVRSYAVLTVLDRAPAAEAFRPSYGDRKQKIYYARDLKRDLLPSLARVPAAPDIREFAEHFRRPWLDVCFFGFDAAADYQAAYGREVGRAVGLASLLLMLDFTSEEKEPLLLNLVQYGIDLWGLIKNGHPGWPAHGGHGSGRKWPILLAGILLGDPDMQSPGKSFPAVQFGEDMQTMYGRGWTGAKALYAGHVGKDGLAGKTGWGAYEHLPPLEWPARIGEDYRRCCTSVAWVGQALAARLLQARGPWGHDAFFDYVDRWMTEDDREAVEEIQKARGWDYFAPWGRQRQAWDPFVNEMWWKYRHAGE
jgi:hypothetical protein